MNNISVSFEKNTIVMNFLNGQTTIPGSYGGYVVASGCGSGKTTIIKEIIRQKFNEGILYAASTIKEVDDVYEWLLNNAVGFPIRDRLNNVIDTLREEDIVVLHSENENSKYMYRCSPEEITKKKVVLCTHYKLLHDSPCILIKQSFSTQRFRKSLTQIRDSVTRDMEEGSWYNMPRQYILIDELPSCDQLKAYFQKAAKIGMLETVNNSVTHYDNNNQVTVCDKLDFRLRGFKSKEETVMSYHLKVKGYPYDPFPESANTDDPNKLSIPAQLRKDLLIDSFIENESLYIDTDDFNSIKDGYIRYSISDFVLDEMETRLIVFDGTGDLTFGYNNKKFILRNIPKKYSSPCKFIKIDGGLVRKFKESYIKNNENKILEDIDNCCIQLKDIIEKNEKTLIVTWKDLKLMSEGGRKSRSSIKLTESRYNSSFSFPDYITNRINSLGVSKEFSIIHYMSGLDKATNQFKDYDSVIFLGEFHVPNNVIEEFNSTYYSDTNSFKYTLYQLVQAICRTRIRNHKGESINVYITDDWDNRYIVALNYYLNYNNYDNIDEISESKPNSISLIESSEIVNEALSKLSNKWRPIIKSLDESLIPGLIDDIRNNVPREVSVNFNELYNVYKMKVKEVRKYYPLINYLRRFNINLTITK